MRVKVGNETYDSAHEPVMVIFTDQDKENIKNMAPGEMKYCAYPYGIPQSAVKEFMDTENMRGLPPVRLEPRPVIGCCDECGEVECPKDELGLTIPFIANDPHKNLEPYFVCTCGRKAYL